MYFAMISSFVFKRKESPLMLRRLFGVPLSIISKEEIKAILCIHFMKN